MQKRIFTYFTIGGIYALALFTRFGEIVSPAIVYTFSAFAFTLFAAFSLFYLLKKKTINRFSFDISIILFAIALIILIFTSKYRYGSIMETYKLVSALLMAIMVMNLIETKEDFKIFLYNVVVLGMTVSVISYVFYAAPSSTKMSYIARIYGFVRGASLSSIWQYQNTFGGFLILPLLVSFAFMIKTKNRDKKILLSIVPMFFIFILFLTASRGAFLSCIAAFILFLILSKKEDIPRIFINLLIVLAGAFILILIGAPKEVILRNLGKTTALIEYAGGVPNSSLWRRVHFAILSLNIFKKQPIFGTGLGTFRYMSCINEWIPDQWIRIDPHSLVFKFIAETGILGTATLLFMIFRFFWKGLVETLKDKKDLVVKGLFAGIAGMFIHMCLDVDTYTIMFVILFTVLGTFTYGEKIKFAKPIKKISLTIITSLLIAIALFDIMPKTSASIYALRGDTTKTAEKYLDYYSYAKKLDPNNPIYPYHIGNALKGSINKNSDKQTIQKAIDSYKSAENLNPLDFRFPFHIGTSYLYIRNDASIEYLEKSESLYPTSPIIKGWCAIAYLYINNDKDKAETYINEATEIDETELNALFAKGICMIIDKRYDTAYDYLEPIAFREMTNQITKGGMNSTRTSFNCRLRWKIVNKILEENKASREISDKIKHLESYIIH